MVKYAEKSITFTMIYTKDHKTVNMFDSFDFLGPKRSIIRIINSPKVISYMGLKYYLRYKTPFHFDIPWGWKDLRNTFTLPIWLDIFPEARIIHVYRHGVDVAHSLFVRTRKTIEKYKNIYTKITYFQWLIARGLRPANSLRCLNLEDGFSLWEEYVQEARMHVSALKKRALEVKFEQLLEEPYYVLKTLAKFSGLEPSEECLDKSINQINSLRRYAYRNNPELQAFAKKVSYRLRPYGYEP